MKKFDVEKSPKTFCYVLERDTFIRRCNICGNPVLRSDIEGYSYQCMTCDIDLKENETYEGEFHSDKELNEVLLNTEALLLLDD